MMIVEITEIIVFMNLEFLSELASKSTRTPSFSTRQISPLASAPADSVACVGTNWEFLESAEDSGHYSYRFFLVQASIRWSAFSMFSIEFATLKRR